MYQQSSIGQVSEITRAVTSLMTVALSFAMMKPLVGGLVPASSSSLAFLPETKTRRWKRKPTRDDVEVDTFQERDRLGIWITDKRTDRTIAEWWDDDAREMFEQGFFKPGVPQHSWEKPSREFVDSVLSYAEEVGLLARPGQQSPLTKRSGGKKTTTDLKREWYDKGVEAGKKEGWMNVEDTLLETLEAHRSLIKDATDLVWTDIDLWEETDHFNILYGSKMRQDTGGDIDLYLDLKSEFWEGYLAGRKQLGIDIYQKAKELV